MSTILITGASSGIGLDAAKTLAGRGHTVFAAARRADKLDALRAFGVHPVTLDVTDSAAIVDAVHRIHAETGGIDVLINNAGFGFYGPIEDVRLEDAKAQFDVNVFGLTEMTKAVLPGMRARGAGRIINISSMGGRFVAHFGGWYHASKYAVEALSDALRLECSDHGIDVVIIEPGGIKTPWGGITADNLEKTVQGTAYEKQATAAAKAMRKLYRGRMLSSPAVVTRAIVKAVEAKRPKTRYLIGFGAKPLVLAHALLPDRVFDVLIKGAA